MWSHPSWGMFERGMFKGGGVMFKGDVWEEMFEGRCLRGDV